jgi:6-phosphogluconolactonase
MEPDLRIVEGPDALADLAAASIARWLRETGAPTTLGLAGGGTPRTTYLRLRDEDVPWEDVDGWMTDERWVPPDDAERNGLMAQTTLFDHVPGRLHHVPWTPDDPQRAAAEYAGTLAGLFGESGPGLVLLGMGDDGHTASLFPGTDVLDEGDRSFAAVWVTDKETWRTTATLPLLWSAERLVFLVSGSSKAEAAAAVLSGDSGLPAEQVAGGARNVSWFLDRAAAANL